MVSTEDSEPRYVSVYVGNGVTARVHPDDVEKIRKAQDRAWREFMDDKIAYRDEPRETIEPWAPEEWQLRALGGPASGQT